MLRSTKLLIMYPFLFIILITANCISESADVEYVTREGLCQEFQKNLQVYAVNDFGVPLIKVEKPEDILKKLRYQGIELNMVSIVEKPDIDYYATIVPHGVSNIFYTKHDNSIHVEILHGKNEWTAVCIGIPKTDNSRIISIYK